MIRNFAVVVFLFICANLAFATEPVQQSPSSGCAGKMTAQADEDDSIFAPFPNPNRARTESYFYNYGEERMAIGARGFLTNNVMFPSL